jgi:glycosyltransferase involved in cell wall biosynthesis
MTATGTEHDEPKDGVTATVVVPTTGDRGPLLRYSIGSVLSQSVTDLEVFVIADGITEETRGHITELMEADSRVHLFDYPKHESRGEPNRHRVLTDHATGRFVAYLCDRDLWLPNHLHELDVALTDADFAHTLRFGVSEDDGFRFSYIADIRTPAGRAATRPGPGLIPLSFVGHTMDAYRRLPWGWRTTPPGRATDRHMWEQFMAEPWVRVATSAIPTVLTFKRGQHPGLSTPCRLDLLKAWSERLSRDGGPEAVTREVIDTLWIDWSTVRNEALETKSRRLGTRLRNGQKRATRLGRRLKRRFGSLTGQT